MDSSVGEVFLLKTNDRAIGVRTLMEKCGLHDYSGSGVAVKANFNSADPFPASTILTLCGQLLGSLKVLVYLR